MCENNSTIPLFMRKKEQSFFTIRYLRAKLLIFFQ